MTRKKPKLYTADELRMIKAKLEGHADELMRQMPNIAHCPDFDSAVELRDKAQNLVSTYGAIKNIDNSIYHADNLGPTDLAIDADRCGFTLPEPAQT